MVGINYMILVFGIRDMYTTDLSKNQLMFIYLTTSNIKSSIVFMKNIVRFLLFILGYTGISVAMSLILCFCVFS